MSSGSGGHDYSNQINTALNQANMPKSPLAQLFSDMMGSNAGQLTNNMMNAQGFGNSAFQNIMSPPNQTPPNQMGGIGHNTGNQGGINPPMLGGGGVNPGVGDANPAGNTASLGGLAGMMQSMGPRDVTSGNPGGINAVVNQNYPGHTQTVLDQYRAANQNVTPQQGIYNNTLFPTAATSAGADPGSFGNLDPHVMNMLGSMLQSPGVQNYNPNAALGGGLGFGQLNPAQDPYFQATQQVLHNQFNKDNADLAESFNGTGTGRGTGASYAQAQLRSAEIPQMQSALGQAANQSIQNLLGSQGLQIQNAAQAGQQNLGLQGLNSNNILQSFGLNSNNLNSLLGQQNQFLNNQGNFNLGAGSMANQNNQFNAGQTNNLGLQGALANQSAFENQINRAFTGNQNLTQILAALAGSGIPGGGANVNLSNYGGQAGGGMGSSLMGIGTILQALGSFR